MTNKGVKDYYVVRNISDGYHHSIHNVPHMVEDMKEVKRKYDG